MSGGSIPPQRDPCPAPARAVTSQLNSISASMVAMRTVKVLGCLRLRELKLMRDAMAPAMAARTGQRGGGAMAAWPRPSAAPLAAPRGAPAPAAHCSQ